MLVEGGGVVTQNKQSCLSDKTMTSGSHPSAEYGEITNYFSGSTHSTQRWELKEALRAILRGAQMKA